MRTEQKHSDILAGWLISDRSAYEQLINIYYPPLCYFAFQLVDDYALAEEIVLAAFQRLWNSRQSFKTISAIKLFLYVRVRENSFLTLRQSSCPHITSAAFSPSCYIVQAVGYNFHDDVCLLPPNFLIAYLNPQRLLDEHQYNGNFHFFRDVFQDKQKQQVF